MALHESPNPDRGRPFWSAAWKPLAVAVSVHLLIVVGYSAFFDFNLSCFVNVGTSFPWADADHFAPGTIKYTELAGYDGCDYYVVALDPLVLRDDVARSYKSLDEKFGINKLMRYQRCLYPLLINLLTCDHPRYFPLAMVLINFASMVGMTIVLMKLLVRRGTSPWLGLVFVLGGGMLFGFWLDLQMHLFFFLVISALYYYETDRIELTALLFALALLTWESAVLFAGPIGVWELVHRRWRNVVFLLLALAPFLGSQVYFAVKIKESLFSGRSVVFAAPFSGIVQSVVDVFRSGPVLRRLPVVAVLALFVLMLGLSVWKFRHRSIQLYNVMLFVQLLFFVVQDKRVVDTFTNAIRVNAGICLPFLLSYRDQRDRLSPWLFAAAMLLAVLALVRIFMNVGQPYELIGAGG